MSRTKNYFQNVYEFIIICSKVVPADARLVEICCNFVIFVVFFRFYAIFKEKTEPDSDTGESDSEEDERPEVT